MFADLFIDPGTIARYRSTPLFEERLSYLEHCASEGARRRTLREVAAHQTRLVHLLDLREPVRVSMDTIDAVAMHWSRPDGRGSPRPARPSERQRFVGHALRWLRFVDLLDEPCTARHPHAGEVPRHAGDHRPLVVRPASRLPSGTVGSCPPDQCLAYIPGTQMKSRSRSCGSRCSPLWSKRPWT